MNPKIPLCKKLTPIGLAALLGCTGMAEKTVMDSHSSPRNHGTKKQLAYSTSDDGAYVIAYFESDSSVPSQFDKESAKVLVQKLRAKETARLVLCGHADQHGGDTYNEQLALQRAGAVAFELEKLGADYRQLIIKSYGEADSQKTPHQMKREQLDRKVSVLFVSLENNE